MEMEPGGAALSNEEDEAALARWIDHYDKMRVDLEELLLHRKVFNRLHDIVAKNPRLHRPSYLYDYLNRTYIASAAAGVRRHARHDDPERDAGLLALLFSIRQRPAAITRARHIRLYGEVGMPVRIAEKEFDRLAEPGAAHLSKRHIQPDIDGLRRSSGTVERFATKTIAHLDLEGPSIIPTYPELDAALDEFERIVKRYKLLLYADGGEVVPLIMEPWEQVLKEPWIVSRLSE